MLLAERLFGSVLFCQLPPAASSRIAEYGPFAVLF